MGVVKNVTPAKAGIQNLLKLQKGQAAVFRACREMALFVIARSFSDEAIQRN